MDEGSDTKQAVISYPAGLPQLLELSDNEFARELQFLAAAKLFELGKLSSGKAAWLAEMSRVSFLYELDRIGVGDQSPRGGDRGRGPGCPRAGRMR